MSLNLLLEELIVVLSEELLDLLAYIESKLFGKEVREKLDGQGPVYSLEIEDDLEMLFQEEI